MSEFEAIQALNNCIFDPPLTKRNAVALWREYRDRVHALAPRNPVAPLIVSPLTEAQHQAAQRQLANVIVLGKSCFAPEVIKIDPSGLIAKQLFVVTERSEQYCERMNNADEQQNLLFGMGLNFSGQLPAPRCIGPNLTIIDLPHDEFTAKFLPNGQIVWAERD